MCIPDGAMAVLRQFDTVADALDAGATLCGPRCTGNHLVAWSEHGVIAVEVPLARQQPPLPVLLSRLYPRPKSTPPPAVWPAPPAYNTPLRK
jgi:hypothetical protein